MTRKRLMWFGVALGLMPPLDLRYADARGGHLGDYDPATVSSRNVFRRSEVVGRFFGFPIRQRILFNPLFGRFAPIPLDFIKANNPTDMLVDREIRPACGLTKGGKKPDAHLHSAHADTKGPRGARAL